MCVCLPRCLLFVVHRRELFGVCSHRVNWETCSRHRHTRSDLPVPSNHKKIPESRCGDRHESWGLITARRQRLLKETIGHHAVTCIHTTYTHGQYVCMHSLNEPRWKEDLGVSSEFVLCPSLQVTEGKTNSWRACSRCICIFLTAPPFPSTYCGLESCHWHTEQPEDG